MSDALKELSKVREKRDALEKRVFELVETARKGGASWQQVGDALGMSRQAAWERFESWRMAPDSKHS